MSKNGMYRTIMEGGILKITKPTRDLKFWLKAKVCQPVHIFILSLFSYFKGTGQCTCLFIDTKMIEYSLKNEIALRM